jgi:hypothetical protein
MGRTQLWSRSYTSVEHYELSVAPHRQRFRKAIGVLDTRVASQAPEFVGSLKVPAQIAKDHVTKSARYAAGSCTRNPRF